MVISASIDLAVKVFKVLWSEPDTSKESGPASTVTGTGHTPYQKIRYFTVIREGYRSCQCLPIQTYERRGLTKWGTRKSDHAIIHTGEVPPSPLPGENAVRGEEPMRKPIRVTARTRSDKLDKISRINYNKIFTVEHNVKVFEFGEVHHSYHSRLFANFNAVNQPIIPIGGAGQVPD
ncbi:hypothetical protein P152DRAFT_4804 [Eremomyces bilateralis CBS 781.70]|uniref:DUF6590 domain-containing protein n=1 Tax=Eremomyces bilateralis CBS 781.70 TaxID=1392243 RepID=A0A6G1GGG2_9PEZI|nr:uncharacterized protein P152DRAFT_4804 [Eremomyces bilateralis CBS 781.70]KAF1816950.1 hypothetical protein P152DRAFT_4804 [Eremomyces bilateralis CBS 781.70]